MQILKIDESAITAALELYRQQLLTGSVKLAKTKAKIKSTSISPLMPGPNSPASLMISTSRSPGTVSCASSPHRV